MFNKNHRLLRRYRVSLFVLFIFLLSLTLGQSAFALNGPSGNKVVSYNGYRYIDNTHIQVWIDKNIGGGPFDPLQFKIFEGSDTSGTEIAVTNVEGNFTDTNITGINGSMSAGANYKLTSAIPFKAGHTYTVVLNNTLKTNNGINLGQFYSHKDIVFSFTAPNVDGTYAAVTPKIEFRPEKNATNVPHEVMIWFSLNVPMDNTTAAQFSNYSEGKSTLVLKKNGVPVIYDYNLDNVEEGNIYAPIVTTDRTTVIFPMVAGGSSTTCYNLGGNATYSLDIPAITLVNGTVIPAQTVTFKTATDIVPSRIPSPLTAAPNGSNLTISWPASLANVPYSPAATGYYVWCSDNPYWDFVKLNSAPVPASPTPSYTTSGLKPSTTYYFRVSGVNGSAETGFSDYVQAQTPGFAWQKGDANLDNAINVLDVVITSNIILGITDPTPDRQYAADVNNDTFVNILDITSIVNIILGNS